MITDIDLSQGWEGPIWISKQDRSRTPNFEYIPANERFFVIIYFQYEPCISLLGMYIDLEYVSEAGLFINEQKSNRF